MRPVYQAASLIDAQLVHDALQAEGIECTIQGRYLSGAIGELPVDATPSVWVIDEGRVAAAREVLRDLHFGWTDSAAVHSDGDWQCATCSEQVEGGFLICWNCGAARPS